MGGKGGSGGTAISSLKARPYRSIFILCSGFVCRYRILPGGKRQVLNLVLPGDLIGFPTCFFENAINSLSSLTEVVVATVPFQAFHDLFARFPASPSHCTGAPPTRPPYTANTSSISDAALHTSGWPISSLHY
jgi:Cyclic nucleotide-binding domain